MAGFLAWDQLPFTAHSSCAKTVLESIWPEVIGNDAAVMADAESVLLYGFSRIIARWKLIPYPNLANDDNYRDAVIAGELWARSAFHQRVLKFENPQHARGWFNQQWALNPPNLTAPQRAACRARDGMAAVFPQPDANAVPDPLWNQMTLGQQLVVIYEKYRSDAYVSSINGSLTAFCFALSKMGNYRREWMDKRVRDVRANMNDPDVDASPATARIIWDYYGVKFAPTIQQWEPMFFELRQRCHEKNLLRLKITLEQSAEQGFAVCKFITDAMTECSDFNWNRFEHPRCSAERAIGVEMNLYRNDLADMIAQPWKRYSGDPGNAAKYTNLGYLAKRLLHRIAGINAVTQYRGLEEGTLPIRHRLWIDQVLDKYMRAKEIKDRDQMDLHAVIRPDDFHGPTLAEQMAANHVVPLPQVNVVRERPEVGQGPVAAPPIVQLQPPPLMGMGMGGFPMPAMPFFGQGYGNQAFAPQQFMPLVDQVQPQPQVQQPANVNVAPVMQPQNPQAPLNNLNQPGMGNLGGQGQGGMAPGFMNFPYQMPFMPGFYPQAGAGYANYQPNIAPQPQPQAPVNPQAPGPLPPQNQN